MIAAILHHQLEPTGCTQPLHGRRINHDDNGVLDASQRSAHSRQHRGRSDARHMFSVEGRQGIKDGTDVGRDRRGRYIKPRDRRVVLDPRYLQDYVIHLSHDLVGALEARTRWQDDDNRLVANVLIRNEARGHSRHLEAGDRHEP